jgi:hypothetical protein
MASVGLGNYVVVILHVGGTKTILNINKLVLQLEPRTEKCWFLVGMLSCLTTLCGCSRVIRRHRSYSGCNDNVMGSLVLIILVVSEGALLFIYVKWVRIAIYKPRRLLTTRSN